MSAASTHFSRRSLGYEMPTWTARTHHPAEGYLGYYASHAAESNRRTLGTSDFVGQ